MPDIAPPSPVTRNVLVTTFVKAWYALLGLFPGHRSPLVAFVRERINSKLLTAFQGLLAGSL
jgi:hypothetical protein